MTKAEELAGFAARASYDQLSESTRTQLKIRILDSLGCALGALAADPIRRIRDCVTRLEKNGPCTLLGGGSAGPDRAALLNGALVRYLDYNDSYLAKGETCHPSDNLAALLAAAEYADRSGRELLTALAVAYQVQCRLCDEAPVRFAGFDHTTQGSYAVAAGLCRCLELTPAAAANAIAISGTALNALRVTRTGKLSHWKGLAYPFMASCSTTVAFLALHGLTGPLEVFEGEKGFMDAISGPFEIDWSREDLERVGRTILKRHNAEIHSQTAIEAVLKLKKDETFDPGDIERIEIETFEVAYNIIGGGEEGDKKTVIDSKERADHSLPYIVAVALLDGQVLPDQYLPQRIQRQDVQRLLRLVSVRPSAAFSVRFPAEMPCRINLFVRPGRILTYETSTYPGFVDHPMSWEMARMKFDSLSAPFASEDQRTAIAEAVGNLEQIQVSHLIRLLGEVQGPAETS